MNNAPFFFDKIISVKLYKTKENKEYWEYLKNISGNRLYSDKEILDIRLRLKNGESKESIYQDYKNKTSHSSESFNDICSGKRYTHIKV